MFFLFSIYSILFLLDVFIFVLIYLQQLKSASVGGTVWYHLIEVLVVIFEESQINSLIYRFAKKLIGAGFLKHLFDLKANKIPISEWYDGSLYVN